MPRQTFRLVLAAAFLALAARAPGQEHQHAHDAGEQLGAVHFPTSCRGVDADFTRAVALLHSFGYEESRRAFETVAAKDPACGMAFWGVAMTWYHPIWAPPNPKELAAGAAAAQKAQELGAGTDRERGYIAAIGTFYRDWQERNHNARANDYKAAMEALAKRFPDDHEATIFYALEVRATAPENDPTYAEQKRAAKLLNDLLPLEPNHPGIAHYMIHAFDYPALASEALPAARAYAKIAPSSPHALHMPSHIFTRLGLWQESIDSNLASADAARRLVALRHPGASSFDALHALDYLEYAYLQVGGRRRGAAGSRGSRSGEIIRRAELRGRLRHRGDSRPLDAGAAQLEERRAARAFRGRPALGDHAVRAGDHLLRTGSRRGPERGAGSGARRRWRSSRRSRPVS